MTAQETAKPSARPDNVGESNWVPLSETFGFVITKDFKAPTGVRKDGKPERLTPANPPPVTGYFVIRREGVWCRANVENPGTFTLLPQQ